MISIKTRVCLSRENYATKQAAVYGKNTKSSNRGSSYNHKAGQKHGKSKLKYVIKIDKNGKKKKFTPDGKPYKKSCTARRRLVGHFGKKFVTPGLISAFKKLETKFGAISPALIYLKVMWGIQLYKKVEVTNLTEFKRKYLPLLPSLNFGPSMKYLVESKYILIQKMKNTILLKPMAGNGKKFDYGEWSKLWFETPGGQKCLEFRASWVEKKKAELEELRKEYKELEGGKTELPDEEKSKKIEELKKKIIEIKKIKEIKIEIMENRKKWKEAHAKADKKDNNEAEKEEIATNDAQKCPMANPDKKDDKVVVQETKSEPVANSEAPIKKKRGRPKKIIQQELI